MIKLQETTEWEFPNHIYLLTDDKYKCLGYIKVGTSDAIMFSKPMKFDARKRTFKVIK